MCGLGGKLGRLRWVAPHSGEMRRPNSWFDDVVSPEHFVAEAKKWVELGAQVVGGCCGLGPEHTRLLGELLPDRVPRNS